MYNDFSLFIFKEPIFINRWCANFSIFLFFFMKSFSLSWLINIAIFRETWLLHSYYFSIKPWISSQGRIHFIHSSLNKDSSILIWWHHNWWVRFWHVSSITLTRDSKYKIACFPHRTTYYLDSNIILNYDILWAFLDRPVLFRLSYNFSPVFPRQSSVDIRIHIWCLVLYPCAFYNINIGISTILFHFFYLFVTCLTFLYPKENCSLFSLPSNLYDIRTLVMYYFYLLRLCIYFFLKSC